MMIFTKSYVTCLFILGFLVLCLTKSPTSKIAFVQYVGRQHDAKCSIKNFETLRQSAIVFTWSNASVPCYRTGGGSGGAHSTFDLKYAIRSLLVHVSWHTGPIYIVSPGHIPTWLNLSNPRIRVIDQHDILVGTSAPPSSFVTDDYSIDQYLYRIPDVTPVFLRMSPKYILSKPLEPYRLFTCDGNLRFICSFEPVLQNDTTRRVFGGTSRIYNQPIRRSPVWYVRKALGHLESTFRPRVLQTVDLPLLHFMYMREEGRDSSGGGGITIEPSPLFDSTVWQQSNASPDDLFPDPIRPYELPVPHSISSNIQSTLDCKRDASLLPKLQPPLSLPRHQQQAHDEMGLMGTDLLCRIGFLLGVAISGCVCWRLEIIPRRREKKQN